MDTWITKEKQIIASGWLLQEVAGCAFLEVRISLCEERNETFEELAFTYSMAVHEIQAIEQFANEKASRVK